MALINFQDDYSKRKRPRPEAGHDSHAIQYTPTDERAQKYADDPD